MIWNVQPGRGGPDRSEFVAYITNQIESVCGGDMELTEGQLSEIAGAVETFLEKETDGNAEDRVLMMLASRALFWSCSGFISRSCSRQRRVPPVACWNSTSDAGVPNVLRAERGAHPAGKLVPGRKRRLLGFARQRR